MFVREKHLWKRKLWCRTGMRFSVKSLCCQGNWAYLENRPHCALTSVDKSQAKHLLLFHFRRAKKWNYSVKLCKTPDCCKILTAQFNTYYGNMSRVRVTAVHFPKKHLNISFFFSSEIAVSRVLFIITYYNYYYLLLKLLPNAVRKTVSRVFLLQLINA